MKYDPEDERGLAACGLDKSFLDEKSRKELEQQLHQCHTRTLLSLAVNRCHVRTLAVIKCHTRTHSATTVQPVPLPQHSCSTSASSPPLLSVSSGHSYHSCDCLPDTPATDRPLSSGHCLLDTSANVFRPQPATVFWPLSSGYFCDCLLVQLFSFRPCFCPLSTVHKVIRYHGRMEMDGHGLPKVSPGLALPYPSMPCGRTTPEVALRLFQGWPTHRASGLQPSSIPLNTPRCMPMAMTQQRNELQLVAKAFPIHTVILNFSFSGLN
jgi:hypothetical protein